MLVMTDSHIYYLKQTGIFSRTLVTWNMLDLKNVSMGTGSFLESYFDFGALSFSGKSGETITISGISDLSRMKGMKQ